MNRGKVKWNQSTSLCLLVVDAREEALYTYCVG